MTTETYWKIRRVLGRFAKAWEKRWREEIISVGIFEVTRYISAHPENADQTQLLICVAKRRAIDFMRGQFHLLKRETTFAERQEGWTHNFEDTGVLDAVRMHDPTESLHNQICLDQLLQATTPKQRITLHGLYIEGQSTEEFAKAVGCTASALVQQRSSAFSKMRAMAGVGVYSGNSSASYAGIDKADRWKRVPEWDDRVREILK